MNTIASLATALALMTSLAPGIAGAAMPVNDSQNAPAAEATTLVQMQQAGPSFVDDDGDGICDNRAANGQGNGYGPGNGNGFVDDDGDGICDNRAANGQGNGYGPGNGNGNGNGNGYGNGRCGR